MDDTTQTFAAHRAHALKRCRDNISWYRDCGQKHKKLHNAAQGTTILSSALAPVLVAVAPQSIVQSSESWWRLAIALLPAIAGIATSLSTAFMYRDNYLRFMLTSEKLKSEMCKYETRSGPDYGGTLTEEAALSAFVQNIETLIISEGIEWRQFAVQMGATTPNQGPNQA